ncbi:MAG: hypothetical protein KKH94_03470 [Candidatus Omnitrophica bacterium]|nr:hypothetical protein [Candidatus Omnitrophota bacterium]
MKRRYIVYLVCIFIVMHAVPCYAGPYWDQMKAKLSRGFINIVSSIGEVGKGMGEGMGEEENAFYGAVVGVFKGGGKMVVRAFSGIYDIIVSPIPRMITFPPDPETLFTADARDYREKADTVDDDS